MIHEMIMVIGSLYTGMGLIWERSVRNIHATTRMMRKKDEEYKEYILY